MQITKKTNKKTFFIVASVVIFSIAAYMLVSYAYSLWPFEAVKVTENTKQDSPKKTSNKPHDNNDQDENSTSEDSSDSKDINPTNPEVTPSDDPSYINPPLINPPSTTDPYPIHNERYSIIQESTDTFSVTLYPIVNNPEYSDYNAQLRAYKKEVLDYLKIRHGDTNNLIINWSPADAKNI